VALALSVLGTTVAEAAFPGRPGMLVIESTVFAANPGIYTVNPDGSGYVQRVDTPTGFNDSSPAWSPTGRLFAWGRHDNNLDEASIMVMRADGSGQAQVGPTVVGNRGSPAFAPSGNSLAHTCDPADICSLTLAGVGGRLVSGADLDGQPVFSRDGRLFFIREDTAPPMDTEVWVREPGGAQRRLTDDAVNDFDPDVSPDGKTLVVSREVASGWDLFAIDSRGGGEVNLTNDATFNDFAPAFSPTGRQIAYKRSNDFIFGTGTAHVIPSTGGVPAPVPNLDPISSVDWQPIPVKCGGRRATQVGTGRRDTLLGTRGRDVLAGLGGRDRLKGKGGNDILCGGAGTDKLIGGKGKDSLHQ
jgi:Tol biopolymer transport system component